MFLSEDNLAFENNVSCKGKMILKTIEQQYLIRAYTEIEDDTSSNDMLAPTRLCLFIELTTSNAMIME